MPRAQQIFNAYHCFLLFKQISTTSQLYWESEGQREREQLKWIQSHYHESTSRNKLYWDMRVRGSPWCWYWIGCQRNSTKRLEQSGGCSKIQPAAQILWQNKSQKSKLAKWLETHASTINDATRNAQKNVVCHSFALFDAIQHLCILRTIEMCILQLVCSLHCCRLSFHAFCSLYGREKLSLYACMCVCVFVDFRRQYIKWRLSIAKPTTTHSTRTKEKTLRFFVLFCRLSACILFTHYGCFFLFACIFIHCPYVSYYIYFHYKTGHFYRSIYRLCWPHQFFLVFFIRVAIWKALKFASYVIRRLGTTPKFSNIWNWCKQCKYCLIEIASTPTKCELVSSACQSTCMF